MEKSIKCCVLPKWAQDLVFTLRNKQNNSTHAWLIPKDTVTQSICQLGKRGGGKGNLSNDHHKGICSILVPVEKHCAVVSFQHKRCSDIESADEDRVGFSLLFFINLPCKSDGLLLKDGSCILPQQCS